MKFHVLRRHIGDKLYEEGDEREADERDVAHLVRAGVLTSTLAKEEPAPKNKAAPRLQSKSAPLGHDDDGKKGGSLPKSERAKKA